jgi:hypothetical protein
MELTGGFGGLLDSPNEIPRVRVVRENLLGDFRLRIHRAVLRISRNFQAPEDDLRRSSDKIACFRTAAGQAIGGILLGYMNIKLILLIQIN